MAAKDEKRSDERPKTGAKQKRVPDRRRRSVTRPRTRSRMTTMNKGMIRAGPPKLAGQSQTPVNC
jgi:hypothetical protein